MELDHLSGNPSPPTVLHRTHFTQTIKFHPSMYCNSWAQTIFYLTCESSCQMGNIHRKINFSTIIWAPSCEKGLDDMTRGFEYFAFEIICLKWRQLLGSHSRSDFYSFDCYLWTFITSIMLFGEWSWQKSLKLKLDKNMSSGPFSHDAAHMRDQAAHFYCICMHWNIQVHCYYSNNHRWSMQ